MIRNIIVLAKKMDFERFSKAVRISMRCPVIKSFSTFFAYYILASDEDRLNIRKMAVCFPIALYDGTWSGEKDLIDLFVKGGLS